MTIFYRNSFAGGIFEDQRYICENDNKITLVVFDKDISTEHSGVDCLCGRYSRKTIRRFLDKYGSQKYVIKYVDGYNCYNQIIKVE